MSDIDAPEQAAQAKPKKKNRRLPIVLGVIVAVVIVAGIGLVVWHNQPSFCSAICHNPMDPYLVTYEAEVGSSTIDKWGNEVDDSSGMYACVHREAELDCMDCHIPTTSEQIAEAKSWITKDFSTVSNEVYGEVIIERDQDDLVEARGLDGEEFCQNEECHDVSSNELMRATAKLGSRNPHLFQHGDMACTDCHKAHRQSVNACSECHDDAPIPDGWLSYDEERDL